MVSRVFDADDDILRISKYIGLVNANKAWPVRCAEHGGGFGWRLHSERGTPDNPGETTITLDACCEADLERRLRVIEWTVGPESTKRVKATFERPEDVKILGRYAQLVARGLIDPEVCYEHEVASVVEAEGPNPSALAEGIGKTALVCCCQAFLEHRFRQIQRVLRAKEHADLEDAPPDSDKVS